MSRPDYELEFAAEAKSDLEDIALYTLATWGEQQMNVYSEVLGDAFDTIKSNPNIGHTHQLAPAYKCFQAGRHLIFYRLHQTTVYVS